MYIVKNAVRNIIRSKGRNVLIGIIVFILMASSCIALSIRQAANTAKEKSLESMKITASISFDRASALSQSAQKGSDRDDMVKQMQSFKDSELSIDEMLKYSEAASVKSFYYSTSVSFDAGDSFQPIDTSSSTESNENQTDLDMSPPNDKMRGGMGQQGDFTVIGYSSDEAMIDFINGTSAITEGSMFETQTSENNCVISDELATLNSIKVGDKITLVNPNNEDETITLTVVGIYHNETSSTDSVGFMGGFSAASDPANRIFMSYKALNSIVTQSEKSATVTTNDDGIEVSNALTSRVSGTYVFSNVDDYNNFESQVRALGLSDDYKIVSSDLANFEESIKPLENLSKYATYFLIVVLIIGGVVLCVLNIFNVRERKYEIGVLAAIGMKKRKIALQFISEVLIVTFLAVTIGACLGASVSLPVTNMLLADQVASQQENQTQTEMNFGRPMGGQTLESAGNSHSGGNMRGPGFINRTVDYVSEVNTATNLTVILQLIFIGIILTLVVSCFAVIIVLRYDPMVILSNRD